MPNILIIEDDAAFCQMLQKFLTKHSYAVEASFTAPEAKSKLEKTNFDLVLTDLRLPDYDGIKLLEDIKQMNGDTPVIVMTGYAEVGSAVLAMKKGAFDYIAKPFTPDEIVKLIGKALEVQPEEKVILKQPSKTTDSIEYVCATKSSKIVKGISEASKQLDEYVHLVAPTDMSVLITGESGTGKEVTACLLYTSPSPRDRQKSRMPSSA